MSTQVINFKKREIVASSKAEAIEMVENELFHINGDATQAFKNWKEKQDSVTERDIKGFMMEYLAKKGKNCPGAGYMITVEPAVGDTRERPYKVEKVKNEKGKRAWDKVYRWVDEATGTTVVEVDTNAADAANAIKEMYKDGYKGNAKCHLLKTVADPEQAVVMTAKYTPSKNTKKGTWIAFGIEA